jgi:hypothetical protein
MEAEDKLKLTTYQKLLKTAEKLNKNEKLRFDFNQEHYYLAYDFNARFITQLTTQNAFKIQGVVYCLSPEFKEKAIKWIGVEELEEYLKSLI